MEANTHRPIRIPVLKAVPEHAEVGEWRLTGLTDANQRVHHGGAPRDRQVGGDGGGEEQTTAGDTARATPGTTQVLRGRGRPRKQALLPDLRDQPVHGPNVERGRRRVRNRTGRYELQYQVEFRAARGATLQWRWLDLPGYEALLDGGKLADELEGDCE
jgi:hypothetical protein